MKNYFIILTEFYLVPADRDVLANEIKNLETKKAASQDDILVKILKLNNNIIFSAFVSDF